MGIDKDAKRTFKAGDVIMRQGDQGTCAYIIEEGQVEILMEKPDGSGYFSEVVLCPVVTITEASQTDKALQLHHEANKMCFVANSCNFPIRHEPQCLTDLPQS